MLNQASIEEVEKARFSTSFRRPLYGSYSFSRIATTVEGLFGRGLNSSTLPPSVLEGLPKSYSKVLLFFVDAFGWRFLERHRGHRVLSRFLEGGCASKLTSQFPSTTAAHTTSIHTGVPLYESGIHEWYYYEPKVGSIIAPLLFSFASDDGRNTLKSAGIRPETIFPPQTLYQRLAADGIASHVFQYIDYIQSPFSDVVCAGAKTHPYLDLTGGFAALSEAVVSTPGPAYYFTYYDGIDLMGHKVGPDMPQFDAEIERFFNAFETDLLNKIEGVKDTLVIITADHGQLQVYPETALYVDELVPDLEKRMLRSPRDGRPLVPAGSSRDLFMHVKPEYVKEVTEQLREKVGSAAEVYRTSELIEAGIFGKPSAAFLERVGSVVVLPRQGQMVWWSDGGKNKCGFRGHHGGMSPEEMEIPFLALAL